MTPEQRREMVNSALKRKALIGLTPERGKRITNGLSSGSMMLNMALSGSPLVGYVWGRMAEIYGPESSGKTTLALEAVKQAQLLEASSGKDVPVLYVDMEHSLDLSYVESLGVDLKNLTISQPDCGEDALDEIEASLKAGFKLFVVDSVSALVPRAEIEGSAGEAHVGLQARLMSQAMRKLTGITSKQNAIILWINQIRIKVGLVFGNPETTSGGNALKFYATYRLEVRSPRKGAKTGKTLMGYGDTEQDTELGIDVNVKLSKNKVFPPHRAAVFTIMYGKGIDKIRDTLAFLELAGAFGRQGILIPSRKKSYTAKGLATVLNDPAVQRDVLRFIRKLEEESA